MTARSDIVAVVSALLARAPEWIRQDLSSQDRKVRSRAEETLALLVAAALDEHSAMTGGGTEQNALAF